MANLKKIYSLISYYIRKLSGKIEVEVKEPKKKVEIRLSQYEGFFNQQLNLIKHTLERREIPSITREIGEEILLEAEQFRKMNFIPNSRERIDTMLNSLISSSDYAIWINNQSKYLGEKMYSFVTSIRE